MTTHRVQELAEYLANSVPAKDQSIDEYVVEALERFPGITESEASAAIEQAAAKMRRDGFPLLQLPDLLRLLPPEGSA